MVHAPQATFFHWFLLTILHLTVTADATSFENEGSRDFLKENKAISGESTVNVGAAVIVCVILPLVLLVIFLLVNSCNGNRRRIVYSEKTINCFKYQVKISLPEISSETTTIENVDDRSQSCFPMKFRCFPAFFSAVTKTGHAEIDSCNEKTDITSKFMIDASRSSQKVKRISSIATTSRKQLSIIHNEVRNFEEEALTLLSDVMTRHLVDGPQDDESSMSNHGDNNSVIEIFDETEVTCIEDNANRSTDL